MEGSPIQRTGLMGDEQAPRAMRWPWPSWVDPPTIHYRRAATHVVVDDRESGSGMIELLSGVAGLLVEVGRLDAGDYLVDNRVLVERKTIADLASSIADGRLFTQAHRMAGGRLIPVLIIEGAVPQHGIAGMTREAVQGAIISLALSFGVPSLRSRDLRDTANLLRFVADQIRRRSANAVQRHGYRPRGARKRRLFILQGLPGIGPARAERLLDTFGSVESVFQAGQRDLAEVAGIGRATAAKIRSLVAAPASADDERVG